MYERRTWSTVTGKRAPCSSHMAVIPRLRAMTPVRIEFGVHFAATAVLLATAVALLVTEECRCLHEENVGR